MAKEQLLEATPVEGLPARAPVQPRVPELPDRSLKLPQTAVVRWAAVVLVVAPELRVERRGLILNRVVPMLLAPLRHRLHTTPKTFAHGPDVNREPPPSAPRTDMRTAEEIEGRRSLSNGGVLVNRRALLTKHTLEGRQLLREVLAGPLRFTPEGRTYRFEGLKGPRSGGCELGWSYN
jgi:hypothetical protein